MPSTAGLGDLFGLVSVLTVRDYAVSIINFSEEHLSTRAFEFSSTYSLWHIPQKNSKPNTPQAPGAQIQLSPAYKAKGK